MGNMSGLRWVCKWSQSHLRALREQSYVIWLCWRFWSDPGMCRRPHMVTSASSVRLSGAVMMTRNKCGGHDLLVSQWRAWTQNDAISFNKQQPNSTILSENLNMTNLKLVYWSLPATWKHLLSSFQIFLSTLHSFKTKNFWLGLFVCWLVYQQNTQNLLNRCLRNLDRRWVFCQE